MGQVDALRAAMDQLCEARKEEAREVAAYWQALRAEGLPWWLAAKVVVDWHGWKRSAEAQADADDEL